MEHLSMMAWDHEGHTVSGAATTIKRGKKVMGGMAYAECTRVMVSVLVHSGQTDVC